METEVLQKKENKLVPSIRFPEFQDKWATKRLDQISDSVAYGMNAAAIPFDGSHKYLRITDIDEESNSFKPNPLTSPDGFIERKFELKQNDIVFARTGASTGKSYLYNPEDGKLYFAGFLIKFHITKANSYFVFLNTLQSSYNKWVKIHSMRSGQPGLNAEEYKSWNIKLPSLPEQQKIASFLSAVDKKIQQLTRKKALLETYKKGMMQKLFSQEIRFKPVLSGAEGDEDGKDFPDWEEKKLGEIATFSKGKDISKNDIFEDGRNPCIRYGELYTIYNETIDIVLSKTNLSKENLILSEAGDVIIPASGETQIDIATASCVLNEGIALGGDLNIIRGNFNGVFLAYYLNAHLKNDIARLSQGSSVIHLYSKQLSKLQLSLPTLKEQQKIADFLSAIDQKIEAVSQQVEKTQTFKKGLLQQMFV